MLVVALLLSLAHPPAASSSPPPTGNAALDGAIAQYQALEFEKSTIALQKLVLDTSLPSSTQAVAFLWLGLSYGQLGDTDGARQAFHRSMQADLALPTPAETPPALAQMIEEERSSVTQERATAAAAAAAEAERTRVAEAERARAAAAAAAAHAGASGGPGFAAVASAVGAGLLAVGAIGVGGLGAQQLSVAYDDNVRAKPALAAYDTAVTCGVVASVLGGAAVAVGGVSVLLFVIE